jgi:HK97 family phage major capsid protein
MDDIKGLTAKQAREKLADRQEKLGKVFEEAKVTSDSGEKQYDFNKVTILGADVKGSIAVAEKVHAMNLEANALAQHAETLEQAEKAAGDYADREKGVGRPQFPGAHTPGHGTGQVKSLGQLVSEQKAYQSWAKGGAGGGITLNFEEAYPSDLLAKAAAFETMGNKTLMATTAGFAPESLRLPGFVDAVTRPLQVLDIIPMARTGFEQVVYMEETTRVHAAGERAEGAAFAESQFAFTEKTSPVKKITDSLPVTDEQLEDVPFMESYINGRLTFGLRQRLDGQSIVGDAVGANLRGLKNVAGINIQAKGADPAMDAFYKAMTKVRLTGRALPTHHLIHPTDWQGIRLTRTADGIYIFGSPSESGPERLWGLPVVQQDADVQGRGYTGSFQPAWCSLFEKKGVDIQVGFVGTQFSEGKRTVRGDCRFALVWFRPAAFTEVTGL